MSDNSAPPSRINWFLMGLVAGALTAPFWGVLLGPDPGINHPKLRGAR
jgi:hypothetical protein